MKRWYLKSSGRFKKRSIMLLLTSGIIITLLPFNISFIQLKEGQGSGFFTAKNEVETKGTGTWPTYMGNPEHTGYAASILPLNPTILWTAPIPMHSRSSPIVVGDQVIVGSGNGHLYSYNIDSGKIIWDFNTYYNSSVLGGEIRYTPTYFNDTIYVSTENYGLYAVNANDGSLIWYRSLPVRSISKTPVISGNVLGVPGAHTKNDYFYGINSSDGKILWTFTFPSLVIGIIGEPAADNNYFYFGTDKDIFYCLDKDGFSDGNDGYTGEDNTSLGNGDVVWFYNATHPIDGSPTVVGNMVIFGDRSGYLHALNKNNGSVLWVRKVGSYVSAPVAVVGDRIYVHAIYIYYIAGFPYQGSKLSALRLSDGSEIWNFTRTKPAHGSAPVTNGVYIVFGVGDSKLYMINATDLRLTEENRIIWKVNLGEPISTTVAVYDGRIFAAVNDTLYTIGVPEIYLYQITSSLRYVFDGGRVKLTAHLWNNGSVGCMVNVSFWRTNAKNNPKYYLGGENVYISERSFATVDLSSNAYLSTPYIWAMIENTTPFDPRLNEMDIGAKLNLTVLPQISWGWYTEEKDTGRNMYVGQEPTSIKRYFKVDLPGDPIGSPLILKGNVVVLTKEGSLRVYSQFLHMGESQPKLLWSWEMPVKAVSPPVALASSIYSPSDKDMVVVAGEGGKVWALDLFGFRDTYQPSGTNDGPYTSESDTSIGAGDIIWNITLPGSIKGNILPAYGKIFVQTVGDVLYAIDANSGEVEWCKGISGITTLTAGERMIFTSSLNGSIEELDPLTGDVVYSFHVFLNPIDQILYHDGVLYLISQKNLIALDAQPDDNHDGIVDSNDTDDGLANPQNITYDLIITFNLTFPSSGYPFLGSGLFVLPEVGGVEVFDISTSSTRYFIPIPDIKTVLGVKDGMIAFNSTSISFYTLPSLPYTPEMEWEVNIENIPHPAFLDGYIYLYSSSSLISLGAENRPPRINLRTPKEGDVFFTNEEIPLDLTGSIDPDGDDISFEIMSDRDGVLYKGASMKPIITLLTEGHHRITIKASDPYGTFSLVFINVTALEKKVLVFSSPAQKISVTLCFGGLGYVDFSEVNVLGVEGRILIPAVGIRFVPFFENEPYIISWANVTMDGSGVLPPFGFNLSQASIYVKNGENWQRAPASGGNVEEKKYWSNTTSFGVEEVILALGILDNHNPQLFGGIAERVSRGVYDFYVYYLDYDNDPPQSVMLVIDNQSEYEMVKEKYYESDYTTGVRYVVHSVKIHRGVSDVHSYYFYGIEPFLGGKSKYYTLKVPTNHPPVPNPGISKKVKVGEIVIFNASRSYDPDGDPLNYYWDFDISDGFQVQQEGKIVSWIFNKPGNYTVTLKVDDGELNSTAYVTIEVYKAETSPSTSHYFVYIASVILIVVASLFLLIFKLVKGHREEAKIEEMWEKGFEKEGIVKGRKGSLEE